MQITIRQASEYFLLNSAKISIRKTDETNIRSNVYVNVNDYKSDFIFTLDPTEATLGYSETFLTIDKSVN